MSTPEAKVRDPVVRWAKGLGVEHQRMSFRPGVKRAFPDDMFLIPGGRPLFWEFKAPGKEPTPLQAHRIQRLAELGYDVGWSSDSDAARSAILLALDAAALHGPGGGFPRHAVLRGAATPPGRP
jgi:hypothetical protein